jgi:hypothetical protein
MPRNSRALFPTEDRTNTEPRTREGRYSHGLCGRLSEAFPDQPWGRFPVPFPPALSAPGPAEPNARHSRALPAVRVDGTFRRRRAPLRFVHQDPPRPFR